MKRPNSFPLGVQILHYFLRSRLETCDFIAPVLVREKLVFSDCGEALRLDSVDVPPLDIAFLWSTSTLGGKSPWAFS
jgi:hypothetical protein